MHRVTAVALLALLSVAPGAGAQQASPSAAERMSAAGPQQKELERQTGSWDVVATLWPAPSAEAIVTRGLVAERKMIGSILQEIMQPAPTSGVPDFRRLDYLNFDRVEGRWKYVSMDTRFPVSIMPAWSFGPTAERTITLQFEPQAFVGFGSQIEGRLMISNMVISQSDANHVLKEQHVMMSNGTGESWLFTRYEYTRRR
jgi:hypothetical protein